MKLLGEFYGVRLYSCAWLEPGQMLLVDPEGLKKLGFQFLEPKDMIEPNCVSMDLIHDIVTGPRPSWIKAEG